MRNGASKPLTCAARLRVVVAWRLLRLLLIKQDARARRKTAPKIIKCDVISRGWGRGC